MQLDPNNSNIELQYTNLLWIEQKKSESQQIYLAVLKHDPANRYALESLGYLMRDMHLLPKRGDKPEWQHSQDYWAEKDEIPAIDLDDPAFVYG